MATDKMAATLFLLLIFSFADGKVARAQMERQRVVAERPVELVFPATRHIQLPTTESLANGELYYSILHSFGRLDSGYRDFWGLDQGANIRFIIEYGWTDRLSAFIGRSSADKVFESGWRYHLLRQTTSGAMPLSLSLVMTGGIMTRPGETLLKDFKTADRFLLAFSIPATRKFSGSFSAMVVPMGTWFSQVDPFMSVRDSQDERFIGLGTGARYKYSARSSATLQYVPVSGKQFEAIRHAIGLGLDLETGGHVFQLFITNSRALNEPYLLASATNEISFSGFHFGFNINRSFQVR